MRPRRAQALGLGGVVGPMVFAAATVGAASLRPEYSHLHQFISELGATGTSYAGLMNYAGFVPTGLLILAFAASTRTVLPAGALGWMATALLAFFGIGIVTAGLVACDAGCPDAGGTLPNTIHNTVSPLAFVSAIAAIATFAISSRRIGALRSISSYSAVTSLLGLAWLLALINSLETRAFTGLWQRLFLATVFLWCAIVALRVYRGDGEEAT